MIMNLAEFLDVSVVLPDLNFSEMPSLEIELPFLEVEMPDLENNLAF